MLLTGAVEAKDLAQGALRRFTQCRWVGHTTFQLIRGTLRQWRIYAKWRPWQSLEVRPF